MSAFCLTVLLSSQALAQLTGTLTSGTATFTQSQTPTSINGTTFRATFMPDGQVNNLYDQWMFYRINGSGNGLITVDTRERTFGNYTTGGISTGLTGTFSGSAATYNLTDSRNLSAAWNINLNQSNATTATLSHSVTFTNTNTTSLNVTLIQYIDLDLNSVPSGSNASGGLSGMLVSDSSGHYSNFTPGTTPNAYQVTAYSTLRTALVNNSITNLNNTGLPFTNGDYTGAYQWDFTIGANSSLTINSSLISAVPEPGSIVLISAGLAGAAGVWKKRRNRRNNQQTVCVKASCI
ncbi:MAG: PEP-CTERM sorting domain-containing protein [Gemmataceae bacterium]